MFRKALQAATLVAIALMAMAFVVSCSQTETAKFEPPTYYSDEAIAAARQLTNEGYTLLGEDSLEAAVAKFSQIGTHVDSSVQEYHIACAYGRKENVDKAFENLTSMLARGFDKPDDLRYDTDYENLRKDERFDKLIEQAQANFTAGTAALAGGLPVYDAPVDTFATEEAYTAWSEAENNKLRQQRSYWTASQYLAGQVDLVARQLAALLPLKADDPEYDAGLERIRAAAQLKSSYELGWGAISDMVEHEAKKYFSGSPSDEGADEANYRTGFSVSLKYTSDDPDRSKGFATAATYLSKVGEGSAYYPAAQAMLIMNKLHAPEADDAAAGAELKALIEQFPGDDKLFRVVATQTENQVAQYLWPLSLGMTDLDGKTVTLEEYRGKTLLIDFWATWCSPCRAELPNLVDVYNRYHDQGLEILSVSLDYANRITVEEYTNWADSAGMNWRHTYDGEAWATPIVKRFFVGSIPAPFLVGPDGSLAGMGEELRGEDLEATVKKSLGI